MRILGLSCYYHDSAACLLEDGTVRSAVQEERFTRKKHDSSFPVNAISWCLAEAGISSGEIDLVVFYDKTFLKFERLVDTWLRNVPGGWPQFHESAPVWMKDKLWIKSLIAKQLAYKGEILFCGHHLSHAASAFYPSPFPEAAVVTVDGVGEWDTASICAGEGNSLELLSSLRFPHSLGLLYSAFTAYCGFRVNSGEYKLMGLAPYGRPSYVGSIRNELIELKEDGSFRLNMRYFDYCSGLSMTNRLFHRLLGGPPRVPETAFEPRFIDAARSIQDVTEEVLLRICRHAHARTGKDNLCLAGGVALNCVANGRILREGPFKNIWIQPASGDAGGALGAAYLIWHDHLNKPRFADGINDRQDNSLLGPRYGADEIEAFLRGANAVFTRLERAQIPVTAARLIADKKVVGWFQGAMEFGPRALGSRSILGDARDADMQSRMNLKIKNRESFRPFAAAVLAEKAGEWFELDSASPYMLLTARVRSDKLTAGVSRRSGLDAVKDVRSVIPAVTHVDNSCRLQTVARESSPLFYDTIAAFEALTGCPVIINTSFNVRGEPIVCSPADAYRCFMRTGIDCLMLGDFLLEKDRQPDWVSTDEQQIELIPD
jgi:carbamoyltransferase